MARGIKRVGPGKYELRIYITNPRTGRAKEVRKIVHARNQKAAEAQRVRLRLEALEGVSPTKRTTLTDFASAWLDDKEEQVEPSTHTTYAAALDQIGPELGELYVDAIVPADIIAWRKGLRKVDGARPAPATLNGYLRVLRTLLGDACAQQMAPSNPAAAVKMLKSDGPQDNQLTAAQLKAFLAATPKTCPNWHPLFTTLALTGGRWGEVSALQWRDVDHEGQCITLRRAQWRGKAKKKTKTKIVRRVPMPAVLGEVLRDHRATLLEAQDRKRLASGLVFPSAKGTLLHNGGGVTKPFRAAMAHAGITRPINIQGLRRTFNNIVRQTAGKVVAQALMGHVTDDMTEHYSHVDMDERHRAVAAIAELVER